MAVTSALMQQQLLRLSSSFSSFSSSPSSSSSSFACSSPSHLPSPSVQATISSVIRPFNSSVTATNSRFRSSFSSSSSLSSSTTSSASSNSSSNSSGWRAGGVSVADRGGSSSAEADVMGLLLRQRIVFLGFNLDEYAADATISQLLLLDALDPTQDIRLFINSPGGSTNAAMAVYDAIQLCRADVSTIAFGIAASTVAIVLAGGTKGKRFAMPNARIMLHQPLGGASGQAIDVEIQAKEAMHHRKNVTRIISEITGRAFEQVEKDIDRDRYMSPAEAMEYGILDGVIDKDMIIPLCPSPEKVLQS